MNIAEQQDTELAADPDDWASEGEPITLEDLQRIAAEEVRKPPSDSERAKRITRATAAVADLRALAGQHPAGGGNVSSVQAFADAVARVPVDPKERRRVLLAAADRVRCRATTSATAKLVFERVCIGSMGAMRHCFLVADQIGAEIGVDRNKTIQETINRLALDGLLVTFMANDRRKSAVPALLPLDFEQRRVNGKLVSRITAERSATVRALGAAVIIYPCREAVKIAETLRHLSGVPGSQVVPPISVAPKADPPIAHPESGGPHPPGHPKNGGAINIPTRDSHPPSGASPMPGFGRAGEAARDAWGQTDPDLLANARLVSTGIKPKQLAAAGKIAPGLTAAEIKSDYLSYLLKTARPTWGAFIAGLNHAEERKRKALGRYLTIDGVKGFLLWDRQRNGNARAGLHARVETFLRGDGARFAIATRKSAGALRDVLNADLDAHAFTIAGSALEFWLGRERIRVPITCLTNLSIGSEQDRVLAADLVIDAWNREGRTANADIAASFAEAVAKRLRTSSAALL